MIRENDIKSKLKYITNQRNRLQDDLFSSKLENKDLDYFDHIVSDILSNVRDCYDYCAKDILEVIINASSKKDINKIYFPFYENQLTDKRNALNKLQFIKPQLYSHLLDLTKNMENNIKFPNILLASYSDIRKLNSLVNLKKHDKNLKIIRSSKKEAITELNGLQITIPLEENDELNTNLNMKISPEYIIQDTTTEVTIFCMSIQKVTEIVLKDIYSKFLHEK